MLSSYEGKEYRENAYKLGVIDFILKNKINDSFGQYIDEMVEIISNSNIKGAIAYLLIKNNNDLSFITNILESAKVRCRTFRNVNELLQCSSENPPDIIVSEQFIDDMNIGKFVRKLRNLDNCKYIPVISLVDNINNAFLRTMMIYDINSYLLKPLVSAEEILLKCKSQIKTKWLYDDLETMNKELFIKATTDPLTGISNRRYIMEQMEQTFYNLKRYNTKCGIMMFDIDFFKKVNDTYGHDIGDLVLKLFANRLKQFIRKSDIFGRYGGEEFICVLNNMHVNNFTLVAKKFLELIRSMEIETSNGNFKITMSIGGILCDSGHEPFIALKEVDDLLYKSKNNGRNRATLKINNQEITVF
jgi:two-component system cell cycle response regulator